MSEECGLIPDYVLAEILDLSPASVRKFSREGKIPCIIQNGQYSYHLESVLKALTGNPEVLKEILTVYELCPGKKYTYEEYLEIPNKLGRFEVLDGELVKEPSPSVAHQRVSRRLLRILEDYFWQIDPKGEVFCAPLDTTLDNDSVVHPDILYISGREKEIVRDSRIDGAPSLTVEILSPETRARDSISKLQIYQKAWIQHYWLVNPEEKSLQCYALHNGRYILVAYGLGDDIVEHPDFAGLSVDLGQLWN